MKFGPVLIGDTEGKILGHHIAGTDGRRAMRKGKPLTAEDIKTLRSLGRTVIYVAELEVGDVDEDTAAQRVAEAAMGAGLRLSGPATGRVNLLSKVAGVLRVDAGRLAGINEGEGITLATLTAHTAVPVGKMVGTVKILPFAVPEMQVRAAERMAARNGPLLYVDELFPRRVGVILSGSAATRERITQSFDPPLRGRVEGLGSRIETVDFVPLEDEGGEAKLAAIIRERVAAGMEALILAGETAIMDRYDIAPRAIEQAGGEVTCFGAPVDPGNLLLLAYLGRAPILGAPGCARSRKANIIDLVLPRLLVGDRLTRADIVAYGHGGLLEDVPERPMPRSRLE